MALRRSLELIARDEIIVLKWLTRFVSDVLVLLDMGGRASEWSIGLSDLNKLKTRTKSSEQLAR